MTSHGRFLKTYGQSKLKTSRETMWKKLYLYGERLANSTLFAGNRNCHRLAAVSVDGLVVMVDTHVAARCRHSRAVGCHVEVEVFRDVAGQLVKVVIQHRRILKWINMLKVIIICIFKWFLQSYTSSLA